MENQICIVDCGDLKVYVSGEVDYDLDGDIGDRHVHMNIKAITSMCIFEYIILARVANINISYWTLGMKLGVIIHNPERYEAMIHIKDRLLKGDLKPELDNYVFNS